MTLAQRIHRCYTEARQALLDERTARGHWVGQLSTSALSTATAVSALALVARKQRGDSAVVNGAGPHALSSLVDRGVRWLVEHQNDDGGWGDTEKSCSNISTTMLAVAALHLAGVADHLPAALARAQKYIQQQGGLAGLRRRYGKDRTFAVPIITNYALAGLVPWSEVTPLPFELACLPQSWYRFARMPVVSYAIPALVAVGQIRFRQQPPRFPPLAWLRSWATERSLRVLEQMQPDSGGYLEAVPLTSFVVMSLVGAGRGDHPVVRAGVRFILDSVRADGSWPIDTNLATWNTTLAINALAAAGEEITRLDCLDWLLSCQHTVRHPFTGAEPGGWGWSDLSGAVPDADDTPGALLALAAWRDSPRCRPGDRERIETAARGGVRWLLNLQNADGGWPTFCRGWGKLPFDRSGDDLTAHALRALAVWRDAGRQRHIERAITAGRQYLQRRQNADGSWIPLWFGNQDHPQEENPVYGTAKVVRAFFDLGWHDDPCVGRAVRWLVHAQNADGGWGGGPGWQQFSGQGDISSVEETALAVEALLGSGPAPGTQGAISTGLQWICEAVESGCFRNDSPIGFYFAKLWYHEKLYPITFTVSVLGQAVDLWANLLDAKPTSTPIPT